MDFIGSVWAWITDHATVLAAVITAIATASIAWFTINLAKASNRQGWIAQKTIDLARDEFNATHRPDIVVHAIEFDETPVEGRTPVNASLLCFNKGSNIAALVQVHARIIVTNDLGMDIQRPIISEERDVRSGMKLRFSIVSERSVSDTMLGGVPCYCIGWLAYFDQSNLRRETGFCFRLAYQPPRWERSGRSEYEYSY